MPNFAIPPRYKRVFVQKQTNFPAVQQLLRNRGRTRARSYCASPRAASRAMSRIAPLYAISGGNR